MADSDDDFIELDEFDGDEEFREVITGNRSHVETQEVVSELDAEWFEDHPGKRARVRQYVSGEFDNDSGGVCGDLPLSEGWVVLVLPGGMRVIMRVGTFEGRGWHEGGLS